MSLSTDGESRISTSSAKRQNDWGWGTEMTVYPVLAGESDVDPCPLTSQDYSADLASPGWTLRLDKELPLFVSPNDSEQITTQIVAVRLDTSTPCSVKLAWNLKQQRVMLAMGTVVTWSSQHTVISVDVDGWRPVCFGTRRGRSSSVLQIVSAPRFGTRICGRN